MTAPARRAAYRALLAIGSLRGALASALDASRRDLADPRDRALATAIVHGTLRWQRASDHLVEHFAGRPVGTLDVEVLVILRLSLFQLLHLERVPASAVVDDAVELARTVRRRRATGFVNAVLRSMLRHRHRLPWPPRPADESDRQAALRYLGITCSHPEWLVERWLDRFGFARTEAWVQFNNQAAPLTLRANELRTGRDELLSLLTAQGIRTTPTSFSPSGLIVGQGQELPESAAGLYITQDEASQLISAVLDARPGERALDLCAAPGGKTLAIHADMHQRGVLVACDVRARRVALLRRTLVAGGAADVHVVHIAQRGPLPFLPVFDAVLVDAPCSGLGVVRRDPDIKWRRRESDLPALAEMELDLLRRASALVRPGGRLVYATCSSEPEENEGVVDRFLGAQQSFRMLDLRQGDSRALAPVLDDRGRLRTLPFLHGLEAFFAAAMRRDGD